MIVGRDETSIVYENFAQLQADFLTSYGRSLQIFSNVGGGAAVLKLPVSCAYDRRR